MKQTNCVYFEAERLKYENVGLYHFCLRMGNALLEMAAKDPSLRLKMYVPESAIGLFGSDAEYHQVREFHKFYHPFRVLPKIWHSTYQLSSYLPTQSNIAKLITVHDLNFLHEKSAGKQKKYLKTLQANIYRADCIVCISKFVESELKQHLEVGEKPVRVIYNGNNIQQGLEPNAPKREGLDLCRPFLFSISAISRKKNLHILPYLILKNDLNLVISGMISDKTYYEEILATSRKLGVENRVFFTGPVSEAEKYYLLKHCHLFCFPSIAEGFGLPVVEAMHFGANILLSNKTSLPEIGGQAANYFESFDRDYLILLGKEISGWQLPAEMQKLVEERSKIFSWQKAASEYWREYKKLT